MKKDPTKYQELFGLIHTEHGLSVVEMETRRIVIEEVAAIGLTMVSAKTLMALLNTAKAYDTEKED